MPGKPDFKVFQGMDLEIHVWILKKWRLRLRIFDRLINEYKSGYITIKDPEQLKTKISRDKFGKVIWTEVLNQDNEQLLFLIDLLNEELEKRRKKPKKYVKLEEKQEVDTEILEDSLLLYKIVDAIRKFPLVREDINALTTFLIIFSGQTRYPISAIIEGLSSTGKNTILRAVERFFPEEWIEYFTTATPEAIKYLDPNFRGTLIVYEQAGITSNTGALGLRAIGEGEKIKTILPIRDESGRIVLAEHETNARNFITTTTKVDIEPELATRIFTLSTDDSPDATRKVVETELDYAWTPKTLRSILYDEKPLVEPDLIKQVLRAVNWSEYEVITKLPPFLDNLRFLTPRLRRDVKKLVNLIRILAILNYRRRTLVRVGEHRYIIAGLEDIYVALRIGNHIFRSTFTGLTRRLQECFEMCMKVASVDVDKPFTVKDVQKMYLAENKTKIGYTTVYRYLEQLTDLGYLFKDSSGRQNQYSIARMDITDIQISISKEFADEYLKHVSERLREFEALKNLYGQEVEFIQINLDERVFDPFTGEEVVFS